MHGTHADPGLQTDESLESLAPDEQGEKDVAQYKDSSLQIDTFDTGANDAVSVQPYQENQGTDGVGYGVADIPLASALPSSPS